MSAPSKSGGRAPAQRRQLTRARKSFRCDLRIETYSKLEELKRIGHDGRPEALISVIERLVESADETPSLPWEQMEVLRGPRDRVACHKK
ncbi:MAG TPA: hypothetical protein VFC39_14145 [Acidobacteriaceae bacterium]|nr:hypothetical protein [Acidobacteriaceae bacterium]